MTKVTMTTTMKAACPIVRVAGLIGDEWILLILRELFKRPHRFDELQKATSAATNILTNRLLRMINSGIVEKKLYQERPPRYVYTLTKAGLALLPLTLEMMRYGEDWLPSEQISPLQLRHVACGHVTRPGRVCSACGDPLLLGNLRLEDREL